VSLSRNGFTEHRHLDEVELIHMNGRAYDYNLGRFLSVDPLIQAPTNSQSINPYSYIMNNPLSGIDPTGYCSTDDTLKGCADGLEAGKTQAITNADGKTVGHIGKDSQGNVHVTNNGSEQDQSAVANSMSNVGKPMDINSPSNITQSLGVGNNEQNGRVERQTDGTVLTPNSDQGITSVDADGVPSFDESHEDFHDYYLDNSCSKATAGCNIENVRQGLQRYPAPGASGEPISDEQVGFALPVGYVRHEVSADGGTVINVTLPPNENGVPRHLLNPGIVRRWVTQDKNNVYIHTYGEGTGRLGRPNEILKHQVWDRVDRQAFDWATGNNR
jgi:RHS repeat-associated protein